MAGAGSVPTYRLVVDSGIEGDDQRFTIEVALRGEVLARATDRTKRAAEREAAQIALASVDFEALATPAVPSAPGAPTLPATPANPAAAEGREDG